MEKNEPILVFDSGLGGISVLRHCQRRMPNEQFVYFGDSLHAPYGVKSADEVQQLCFRALDPLIDRGAKALVVACNTATSAAISALREKYRALPIIGTEPAVKPAVQKHPGGKILVLATPMTLQEEKFLRLQERYRDSAEIVPVPCGGLMEFVERGVLGGEAVERYLSEKLAPHCGADAIVLGCTHYPFLIGSIRRVIGEGAEIFDGSEGIARELEKRLTEAELLSDRTDGGVRFLNSLERPEILALSEMLFSSNMP